ncbi:hypothetical protein [Acidovorax sp.]|uniref:hypothetical protein n=1 Tax=Acidovorax sp. TaxID=1872122 RepID=UPI002ACD7E92|nr:hypothetical protein [Acidovorax sp.]MDZ7865385.1 hypothetical protein [Acidovorax sp.]
MKIFEISTIINSVTYNARAYHGDVHKVGITVGFRAELFFFLLKTHHQDNPPNIMVAHIGHHGRPRTETTRSAACGVCAAMALARLGSVFSSRISHF